MPRTVRVVFGLPVLFTTVKCLNRVYESSASTFAINDQLIDERFEAKTKKRLVNDQGLVLFAQLVTDA